MYDTEFWLWTIVPVVNTVAFAVLLVGVALRGWKLNPRGRIVLAFTGTSFVATFVDFVTTWLHIAKMEAGYVLDPAAPFAFYTIVTAWVAGIFLLALGLWKAYDLLRSPKPGKD